MPDDLAEGMRDLYQRRPDQFVGARQALARSLKEAGRADDAKQVQSLRKPSVAAWAINRLARGHADALQGLLRLGSELRDAQARALGGEDGEVLRELGRQRAALIEDLTEGALGELRRLGAGNPEGHRAAISSTLEAVLVDQDLAATVREGILSKEVDAPAGLGLDAGIATEPGAPKPRPTRSAQRPEKTGRHNSSTAAINQAQREASNLQHDAEVAAAEAKSAARESEAARRRVSALRRELETAERLASSAEERATRAQRALEDALGAADRARARAQRLGGEPAE